MEDKERPLSGNTLGEDKTAPSGSPDSAAAESAADNARPAERTVAAEHEEPTEREEPAEHEEPTEQDKAEKPAVSEEREEVPVVFEDDFDANSEEYAAELENMRNNLAANVEEQPRYQKPKLPFKEAVENFIYHNKTKLLIAAVVLVMGAVIIYQSIPEKYDYTFMIFSSNYYFDDLSLAAISDNLERYGEDLDGDGEVKVHAMRFDTNASDYNESMASRIYMAEEFRTQHEAYLVLTDKTHYDVLTDEDEGFGSGLFESYDGMDKWIDVTDSGLFIQTDGAFNIIEGDDRVGLSLVALNDRTRGDEKYEKRYGDAKALLERLLADHPEIRQAG